MHPLCNGLQAEILPDHLNLLGESFAKITLSMLVG